MGTFNVAEVLCSLCLDAILPLRSTDSSFDLLAWFLHTDRTIRIVSRETLVRAFLNHVLCNLTYPRWIPIKV